MLGGEIVDSVYSLALLLVGKNTDKSDAPALFSAKVQLCARFCRRAILIAAGGWES